MRLLYCFTGLARVNRHVTSQWILETFQKTGKNNYWDIIENFSERASKYFRDSQIRLLPGSTRRLTIMLTGYRPDNSIVNTLISNFQDFKNFVDHPEALTDFHIHPECSIPGIENPTMIQAIGQFGALEKRDETQLREMLKQRLPAEALRSKAVDLIQEISERSKSAGTVGKKINTGRLNRNNPLTPTAGYASDEVEQQINLLDQIDLRSSGPGIAIQRLTLATDSPTIFPNVHRNAPCPCGSGKKFRECHRP